ncbi:hypothetical protein OSH93_14740 [Mycobacterium ulcerans]|uniref:Regulatory protein n=1 Tax=Mycobacterium ulcerans TaxID=1809 RepID=A0ABY3V1X1_MYCUL|nr:hypothetical protein [Mycobacterium ulcerans]MEB3970290.1 hypothetical protein [Mycobacterium ulcerans]MEB3978553.1 hypothetical protein [Mycobacterium ulcerans]ULP50315.2 hypothetical protein MJO63_14245 [Mycobacterium ulcerans]
MLVAAMDRQADLEANAVAGSSLLLVTEPTETAVAAAFEHTAVLAQRPANQAPLREIGRLFGRIAHLLDAVADYHDDLARGKWNPLTATATSIAAVRPLCDDALLGIELALADVDFTDGRLARRLLTREVRHSVSRTFSQLGYPGYKATPHGRQEPINFGAQPMSAGPYPGLPGEPAPNPDQSPKRGCWNTCTEDRCCDCTCDCCEGCCDDDCCCDCGDCADCCDCGDCCDCS